MESVSDLLKQLKIIEAKLLSMNEKPKRNFIRLNMEEEDFNVYEADCAPICFWPEDYLKYISSLTLNKYFLITLTFDPKISMQLDQYGQKIRLLNIIDQLNEYPYYACLEKHKSGILHSHILIEHNSIHDLEIILFRHKKNITRSSKLLPAIQIKTVKQTEDDIQRSYDYIWHNKDDHPLYKYIKINI